MKTNRNWIAAAALAAAASVAGAEGTPGVATSLNGQLLLGVNRASGQLVCYDFAQGHKKVVGNIVNANGQTMTGIDAAAHFPGFTNLFTFWVDPADGKNKLVYVDTATAKGTVAFGDLEGGRFTGACGVPTAGDPFVVFAVQQAKIKPPSTIAGSANLNPNNSDSNEFSCTRGDGSVFTRDNLKAVNGLPSDGTFYHGPASRLYFKPKGNGNQNTLLIDGNAYNLQNSNTYTFAGDMVLRVYNDHVNGNGKAMGHWWVQVMSGTVTINGEAQILSPHRLSKVDQRTGVVNEVVRLTHPCTGLASSDGVVFYTASGSDLYKIDTAAQTETKIGTMPCTKVSDLEFVGGHLMAYNPETAKLGPINPDDASGVGTPVNHALGDLSLMVFTPKPQDPTLAVGTYD